MSSITYNNYTPITPFFLLLPVYKIVGIRCFSMEGIILRATEKKEINVIVGENIRFFREQSDYSREKLAELVGITPRFLADAELGFVGVSLTNLKKICEILGISADRLLWKQENKNITWLERLSHIDAKYLKIIEELIQKQLELIALATKEECQKKTRS